MNRLLGPILALLAAAATLTGCGAAPSTIPAPGPAVVVETPTPAPVAVAIPAIDARSTLRPTGIDPAGRLEVPPITEPMQAAWWTGSPRPGAPGPAVILGHVDGVAEGRRGQPGIFARLHQLAADDTVLVQRDDGSIAQFLVTAVDRVPKAAFPFERVYGNTAGPELRLITCGGVFDRDVGHYAENVVVFARAVPDA